MNHITVRLEVGELEGGVPYDAVKLYVDGKSLMSIIRDIELPAATQEGRPALAGSYSWLSRLRKTRDTLTEGAPYRLAILECTCGVPDCWPLLARISVGESEVLWSDFEQPYRRDTGDSGVAWSYANLGPFVFSREEYDQEMRKI